MLLLALMVSFQTPTRQSHPVPQSTVWVDGRGFRIPRLPESQNQAMRQWPDMKRAADSEVADLSVAVEKSLEALPKVEGPELPSETEGLFRMEEMLRDGRFKELADGVVEARLEWLRCMEARPLQGKTDGRVTKHAGDPLTVTQVAQRLRDSRTVDPLSAQYSLMEVMLRGETRTAVEVPDELAEALADSSEQDLLRMARMEVMHREGQRMAKPWNAYVGYLEAAVSEASRLTAQSDGPESPRHRRIRNLLEAQLLSRCRMAIWMSEVMWSDLALSPEGPAPLRPLQISHR